LKVLIIDIDSKIKNYALAKVEKYHLEQGDEVVWNLPLYAHLADKIYVSCVFEKNKELAKEWEGRALIGGSGYDLSVKLSDEIEQIKPRINLGFTTRGCIRNCKFCIVPQKEGKIQVVGDLLDLWDGKSKDMVLLDNNILALPQHFKFICQQAKFIDVRLDFNQGLDHRLLTQEIINELNSIRHLELKFAWDDISDENNVKYAINLMNEKRCTWYVLVNFNTSFEEDLYRTNYLRSRNQNVRIMRYNGKTNEKLTALNRWTFKKDWFQAVTWEEFLKRNYKVCEG
jgi:hypothetical protein